MTEANQSARKALIVLGMHRSGTSALTRVLNLLGVELGNSFLPPQADNPKGFWEHLEIYRTHEAMLNSMGRVWHSILPLPEEWWLDPVIAWYQERLTAIIRAEFSQAKLWGFKDPRLCRLMPAWHPIFSNVGCEPHFIYVLRHPEEVAHSLHRRDGFSREKCFRLWLLHALEAERACRAYPRVFVSYYGLLNDWRAIVDRIAENLRIDWPNRDQEIVQEVSTFLDPALRHHRSPERLTIQDPVLAELVASMYDELLSAARGKEDVSVELFSSLERCLEKAVPTLDMPLLTEELSSFSARWVLPILAERETQIRALREKQHDIETSLSWRMIKGVRQLIRSMINRKT